MINNVLISVVGKVSRLFPTFVFLFVALSALSAVTSPDVPDFAFPTKVEAQSDSILRVALREGKNVTALREAMNICVANALIHDENASRLNVTLMDSVAEELPSPFSNLAYLIEAEILLQDFNSNSNVYESRNLPLDSLYPSDPQEWSGEMFKERILNLIDKATSQTPFLSINEISPILSDYSSAEQIGMNVPQFLALKSVDILKNFSRQDSYSRIPFYPAQQDESVEGRCRSKAMALLENVSDNLSDDNSVVKALAYRNFIFFLSDDERESYLINAVAKLKGTEGEGIILYELWNRYGRESTESYVQINDWLKEFPDGFGNGLLRYALDLISQERIEVEFPKVVLPGSQTLGKVTVNNLEKGYLLVYRLDKNQVNIYDELILKKFSPSSRPLHAIEFGETGTVPFDYNKEVSLPSLSEGLYVIIPSKTKALPKNWNKASYNSNYSTLRVSDIAVVTMFDSNEKDSGKVYVVNARNQQPLSGALVAFYKGDSKSPVSRKYTNKEGFVNAPTGYYRVEASYGKSLYYTDAGFSYYPTTQSLRYNTSILTDLSVYRPGDTLQYAVIGWISDKDQNSILRSTKVALSLYDAEYIKINSDTLCLNEEGRAHGFMSIPKGRLLGNYTLTATPVDYPSSGASSVNFLVEEYKLPPFLVTLEKVASQSADSISFKGMAATFSSMPVSYASVQISVDFIPWRWGISGRNASYNESLSTDSEGSFLVSLPLSNLKGTIFQQGRYSISAEVTSQAGETQKSSPLVFYLGQANVVRPSISDKIEVSGDSVRFNVPVFDMADLPVISEVEYRFSNLHNTADSLSGSFRSPLLQLPASSLPSGEYRMEFKLPESKEWTSTESVIWRKNDVSAPYPTPLWIPVSEYLYDSDSKSVNISFGSYWPEWLLCCISDGESTLQTKWLPPSDSLVNMSVEIPESNPTLFVTLMGMHDYSQNSGVIKIEPCKNLDKLYVRTLSFRKDITAGSMEDWSFSFSVNDDPAPFVNAFAVMSDKALNSVSDFRWHLNIFKPSIYPKLHLSSRNPGVTFSYSLFTKTPKYPARSPEVLPSWQTYGYPLVPSFFGRAGGPVLYRSMATKNMAVMTDAVADMAVEEESAVEAPQAVAGSASEEVKEQLRPVELPLAFFKPDLKADQNGELNINFTVPNFNTTWQLQVAAYNDQLLNTSLILDAVASKPVMVKSSLPQFLHTGDKAQISATVFNNSSDTLPVAAKLLVMNTLTGDTLAISDFQPLALSPSANRVVRISFDVPDNVSLLAVRAYGFTQNNSDGEQGFIPVLPSSAPVIESSNFYAKSQDTMIEMKLPKFDKKASVTLKYCDNPFWEALLSLPVLKDPSEAGSLAIANWLYATLTSCNIVNSRPEISSGLRNILESQDSSLSMSNLLKDPDLKVTSLEASPWLNTALAQTAEIRSLGEYLDPYAVMASVEGKVQALTKLQNADGGFSWCQGMKSSPYISSRIIGVLGYLSHQGLLNPSLDALGRKAVDYYDNYLTLRLKSEKSFNPVSALDYLYSRSMLNYAAPRAIKDLADACCDSIVSRWRHWSVGEKAKGALVLLAYGKHQKEVELIAESIKDFIPSRVPLPQLALALEFFTKFQPLSSTVEEIREKMFLQLETRDLSLNFDGPSIIYALINGLNPEVVDNRELPEIFVGDEKLDLSASQAMIGNFTVDLSPSQVSGKKITIRRSPDIPAWGGVVSSYIQPLRDVKNMKSENISVEKRIFVEDSNGKVKETSLLNEGDKVTVVLKVDCRKDMDYVVLVDSHAACLQPDESLSGPVFIDGVFAYREVRFDKSSFFIENLPAGKYVISYSCHVDRAGLYSSGIVQAQSLYSPTQVAHSAQLLLNIH